MTGAVANGLQTYAALLSLQPRRHRKPRRAGTIRCRLCGFRNKAERRNCRSCEEPLRAPAV